ncbi:DNA translocase FtsK [Lagierella sp.]|uniref:FtsK/SpoIIIE family DNA translocase n=1 Tax=Lagierella sp. TaxID=2849657 RepID=UPI002615F86B|nr:DNA translocase FtsK [Lagierella sp.]
MARRKSKKKSFITKISLNQILSLLCVLLTISYIFLVGKNTGLLGEKIKEFYFTIFGLGSYVIIPLIFFHLILSILNKATKRIHISFTIIYVLFLLALCILDLNVNIGYTLNQRQENANILANNGQGAGIVGAAICFVFLKSIGKLGIYFIMVLSMFFAGVYLLNVDLQDLYEDIKIIFRKFSEILSKLFIKIQETIQSKTHKKVEITKNNDSRPERIENNEIIKEEIVFNDYDNTFDESTNEIDEVITEEEAEQLSIENEILSQAKPTSLYKFPPMELLKDPIKTSGDSKDILMEKANKIEDTLESFGIQCNVVSINKGPTVTCFELDPQPGVKVSKIVNLSDDLALALASPDIRIEAPIPGKSLVGIEVPNLNKESVFFKEIIDTDEFENLESLLPLGLGKDIQGRTIVSSIEKMPHLLIAGATGSGKSVCINTIILSILYKSNPEDVKLILIDPKVVELSIYNGIPHLAIPVVTNPKKASFALNWAVTEMERRYKIFSDNYVRDIKAYNEKNADGELEKLPYMVIIIDELSDLMMVAAGEVEDAITRLAQMARACGIHLIIATQRPSVDVITGTIKANIPSRISFAVSSQIDSRTILDMSGAEKLLGRGDMLFLPSGKSKPVRIQGAFISDKEVENIVSYLKNKNDSDYDDEIIENIEKTQEKSNNLSGTDELFNEAVKIVIEEDSASISMLQRRMKIGYARAGRIIDEMAEMGIISGYEGSKPRKVLVDKNFLEELDV